MDPAGSWAMPGRWQAVTLGVLVGASAVSLVQQVGADPGALAWGVALPLLALALAQQAAVRTPRFLRAALGLAGLLSMALPQGVAELAGSAGRAAQLSPSQSLLLFLASWLVVCTLALLPFAPGAPATPGRAIQAVGGAALALLAPWGLALALPAALAALALLRSHKRAHLAVPPAPARRLSSTLSFVVLTLLCSWCAAFQWAGLRAWLDPSPLGWWGVVSATTLGFAGGWGLARLRRARLGLEPLAAATGIAVGMSTLGLFAPWLAPELPGLLLSWSPSLALPALLAAPSLLAAFALGLAAPSRTGGDVDLWPLSLAAGAGVVLGAQGGLLGAALIPLSAVLGGGMVLMVARRPARRLTGLAGAVLLSVIWWKLPPVQPTLLASGWTAALSDELSVKRHIGALTRSEWELATIGPEGTTALRWVEDVMVADIDGFPVWFQGRNPSAVRFAAHLPALLAADPSHFLLLGDELGWGAITLLSHGPRTIEAAVGQPDLLRAIAHDDEDVRRALLAPEVQLHPVPGAWLLRQSEPVDGVLQILLRPWADSGAVPLSGATIRLARRRLRPGGVYVAALATDLLPAPELRSLLLDFADVFPHGAACLPPTGADHLILLGIADASPPPLARLEERFEAASNTLGVLGFSSALDVADRCALPARALASWAAEGPSGSRWPPHRLPDTLGLSPGLPLAQLGDRVGAPEDLWDLTGLADGTAELERRHQAVRHFLELLGETTSGDMESLFGHAKALQASPDGTRELDTLIAPHLARARESMERARQGGVQHRDWQEAINQLTLARMLHPAALEPRLLEGMVHEARGDNRKAEKLYRSVLESQDDHLQSLFGLARIQISELREAEAEATLVRATEAHPREAAAHQVLGVALLRFGRLEDAEQPLRRASALASADQPEPQAALAELYLAQERPSVAMAHAERATRIEPSAYHYTLLGRCHFDLGRDVPAERAFAQATLIDPSFYPARAGLAHIYALRGDYDQALDALNVVLLADPGNEAARANREEVLRMQETSQSDPRLSFSP